MDSGIQFEMYFFGVGIFFQKVNNSTSIYFKQQFILIASPMALMSILKNR